MTLVFTDSALKKTKRTFLRRTAIVCLLTFTGLSPAFGQTQDTTTNRPAAFDSTAGLFRTSDLAFAAVFFGSLIAIKPLEGVEESLSPDDLPTGFASEVYEVGDAFGNGAFVYSLSGAAFLGGELFGSPRLSRVGLRALGSLVASSLIVFPTKVIVGRRRPTGVDGDADEFDSFATTAAYWSFPSGHAASAFALAGALSDEFAEDAPWVRYVAYPAALLTGTSRVLGRKHWVTDVIAGAAAGVFASKVAGRMFAEREAEPGTVGAVQPILLTGGDGWMVGMSIRTR